MDQPGKVANPARGQLNRKIMNNSLSAFAPENLVSRDGFGSPVPRQLAHLHTQAESRAYIRDSSRFPQRRPLLYLKRPDAIESVPSLSDHAIAYRWRSLPRVRRHRVCKPQSCCCCCFPHSAHWLPTRKKLLFYTVANPARGLLNREKKKKLRSLAAPPPPPPPARAARSVKKK